MRLTGSFGSFDVGERDAVGSDCVEVDCALEVGDVNPHRLGSFL